MIEIKNETGSISVENDVFTNLAGDAATRCFGVKGMATRSKSDGFVQLLRRESMSRGVHVSFCEDSSVAIELHIVVDHGVNIGVLARSIMSEVSYKVGNATGVPVSKVDVFVDSMIVD